jgi:hypothetical protein
MINLRSVPFLASRTRGGPPAPPPDSGIFDDMESYTVGADVAGLDGGTYGWTTSYVSFPLAFGFGSTDDMESYAIDDALNGLNGGTTYYVFWSAAYVAR